MDTQIWGPDGWRLLHSIAVNYPNNPTISMRKKYKCFFNSLEYVLPCIFCRQSFGEYITELPVEPALINKKTLCTWLYRIHNRVNGKLRAQNLNNRVDPDFESIFEFYKNYLTEINKTNCMNMPGRLFIYSIIFNYPKKHDGVHTRRYIKHRVFLKNLAEILPFKGVAILFKQYFRATDYQLILQKRIYLQRWFYKLEVQIQDYLKCTCLTYKQRCSEIEGLRAQCKKHTCRKLPPT